MSLPSEGKVAISHPEDLDRAAILQIAVQGCEVDLSDELLEAVARRRAEMLEALDSNEPVYGVTTGMGRLSGHRLSLQEQREHQFNLLLGRAVGGPPWLSEADVRALMAVRLRGFLNGHSGVSPLLCQFMAERLGDGFLPAVPATGVGSAGEIMPLAHAFQTFVGVGVVLDSGSEIPALEALELRNAAPYQLDKKEGIALLAGAPGATALALARSAAAQTLIDQLVVASAAAVDALQAPHEPYDRRLGELAHDEVLTSMLSRMSELLGEAPGSSNMLQAPASFRVAPHVLAHLERCRMDLDLAVDRGLRSVSDSPVDVEGRFISTSGFHAVEPAARMDALGTALVHAAEVVVQRLGRLLDERFSGLPAQLSPNPGPRSGLVVVHKRAAGTLHRLRSMVDPVTVGFVETSAGQEDAMTFAWEAAAQLDTVLKGVREVTACELLAIRQAWELRRRVPQGPLATVQGELNDMVEFVDEDRPLGPDLAVILDALERGGWQAV